jgi:amino acid transporter
MATDGLLPHAFSVVNENGVMFQGTVISGIVCVLIALLVPFSYLDDMISAGVLLCFNLTNSSLVLIRVGATHNSIASGGGGAELLFRSIPALPAAAEEVEAVAERVSSCRYLLAEYSLLCALLTFGLASEGDG